MSIPVLVCRDLYILEGPAGVASVFRKVVQSVPPKHEKCSQKLLMCIRLSIVENLENERLSFELLQCHLVGAEFFGDAIPSRTKCFSNMFKANVYLNIL